MYIRIYPPGSPSVPALLLPVCPRASAEFVPKPPTTAGDLLRGKGLPTMTPPSPAWGRGQDPEAHGQDLTGELALEAEADGGPEQHQRGSHPQQLQLCHGPAASSLKQSAERNPVSTGGTWGCAAAAGKAVTPLPAKSHVLSAFAPPKSRAFAEDGEETSGLYFGAAEAMAFPCAALVRAAAHTLSAPVRPERAPEPNPCSTVGKEEVHGVPLRSSAQRGKTHLDLLIPTPTTHTSTVKHYQQTLFFNSKKGRQKGRRLEIFKAAKTSI